MARKSAHAKSVKKSSKKGKKPEATEVRAGSVPLVNERHEVFCRLYAGLHGMNFFAHGTRCYVQAFGYNDQIADLRKKVDQIAQKRERGYTTKIQMLLLRVKAKEKIAQVEASGLLSKPIISERVDFLMENMFDDNFADRELGFVMGQRNDLPSKVSAIRHYDDKKGRITKHMDITSDGEPIKSIEIVSPSLAGKK